MQTRKKIVKPIAEKEHIETGTLPDNFPTCSVVFLVNFLYVLASISQIYFFQDPHHWLVGKPQQANDTFATKFHPD